MAQFSEGVMQKWKEASLVSSSFLTQILEQVSSEDVVEFFMDELKSLEPQERPAIEDFFANEVNDSPFSLEEWMVGLLRLSYWLKKQGRASDIKTRLGYIVCCAESVENRPGHMGLIGTLDEMLEKHGYTDGQIQ